MSFDSIDHDEWYKLTVTGMKEQNAALREVLSECEVTFRSYVAKHMSKGTKSGSAKAASNREMADKIQAVLSANGGG